MQLTDEEWKKKLTPEQYRILRAKGTETPFTGELLDNTAPGTYACAACGNVLFGSDTKYESNIPGLKGWPSFADAAQSNAVKLVDDNSFGMHRVEVVCSHCGGHLGHMFDGDEASPTGKHFCINSTCLAFQPDENMGARA